MKTSEFSDAMGRYRDYAIYPISERMCSAIILCLQGWTLYHWMSQGYAIPWWHVLVSGVLAYIMADAVNGLVHLGMDNNTHYRGFLGPYIAAFHLHHAKQIYAIRPAWRVYYEESGTKFWLALYLIGLARCQHLLHLKPSLQFGLIVFSIFSSFAEVSHYWCHHPYETTRAIRWLQSKGVLLSPRRHRRHHTQDNTQYAFLNGASDIFLNKIAGLCCKGYQNYADQDTQAYMRSLHEI